MLHFFHVSVQHVLWLFLPRVLDSLQQIRLFLPFFPLPFPLPFPFPFLLLVLPLPDNFLGVVIVLKIMHNLLLMFMFIFPLSSRPTPLVSAFPMFRMTLRRYFLHYYYPFLPFSPLLPFLLGFTLSMRHFALF